MDTITPNQRSKVMSRIPSKNTTPEFAVRSWLHTHGYRFRIHRKDLPGKPDIILPKYNIIIFVNGCFWHQHKGCKKAVLPKSNQEYWLPKLRKNIESQEKAIFSLREKGWNIYIIWECETKRTEELTSRLKEILERGTL